MKKLTVLLLFLTLLLSPYVYAADDFDTASGFADLSITGHCYTDVDGEGVCDYVRVQTSYVAISDANEYLNFVIPYLGYSDTMSNYEPDRRSTLRFYDDDLDVLASKVLWEDGSHFAGATDYWIFVLDPDVFDPGAVPADLAFFNIELIYQFGEPQTQSRIPEGFRDYLEDHFMYEIDDEIGGMESKFMKLSDVDAFFMSEFDVYAIVPTQTFGILDLTYQVYVEPPEPKRAGYQFIGWRNTEGLIHDLDDDIEAEGGRVMFYAAWQPIESVGTDVIYPEGSIIADALTLIGFNNTEGRLIVYVVTTLLMIMILVLMGLPMFLISIVVLVLTAFFILIGWLPAYATILFGGTALVLMFISMKAGVQNE
jgi:uncharacterized repeat protein (TIGR02543 family)